MYFRNVRPFVIHSECQFGIINQTTGKIWKTDCIQKIVLQLPVIAINDYYVLYKSIISRLTLSQSRHHYIFVFYRSTPVGKQPVMQITVSSGKLDSYLGFPSLIYEYGDQYQIQWHSNGLLHSNSHPCVISDHLVEWKINGEHVSLWGQIGREVGPDLEHFLLPVTNTFRNTIRIGDPHSVHYIAKNIILVRIAIDDYLYVVSARLATNDIVESVTVNNGIGEVSFPVNLISYQLIWRDIMRKYVKIISYKVDEL